MVLNGADDCRRRAAECRLAATQEADDALRVTYLDLARRWRMMAHEAELLQQKAVGMKKTIPGRAERVAALSGSWVGA
jgi:hypothetical protein